MTSIGRAVTDNRRMRFTAPVALMALTFSLAAHAGTSSLFGKDGELWEPRGRLPDFSYAGYHAGRVAIPHVPVVVDAHDFGARGDGNGDQTAALNRAIQAASN